MKGEPETGQPAHTHPHEHADGTVHVHEHGHGHADHEHGGGHAALEKRARRGEPTGPTRSVRLPAALDRWFTERLSLDKLRSASDLLLELILGGLRLRTGYMAIHRRTLERLLRQGDLAAYRSYTRCLFDTFGQEYIDHLESWLKAENIEIPETSTL